MFLWNCELRSPFDYAALVLAASCWVYSAYCLIELRYERRRPLVWWEPVPFSSADLTPRGREYFRRFFFAFLGGLSALLLAAAFCAGR
jgi:hypothetical protein